MTTAIAWTQAALVSQNLASVAVDPLVLSVRLTVAQSKLMVSGQVILYQSERLAAPVGATNVCASVESPLVGVRAPAIAEMAPLWEVELREVVPVLVQPRRPASQPPPVIRIPAGPTHASGTGV